MDTLLAALAETNTAVKQAYLIDCSRSPERPGADITDVFLGQLVQRLGE